MPPERPQRSTTEPSFAAPKPRRRARVAATPRQEPQQLWRSNVLDLIHDAIFVWELGGGIVYWNRGAELLYGYSAAEAIGRVSHDLLRTEHQMPAKSFEAQLLDAGEWTGELTHRQRDGRPVMVSSRHMVVREADGRTYVVETSHDITERKRLERELAERAAELEAIQAVMDGALIHLSLDDLLPELMERIRAVLAVDNVAILLADEQGRELSLDVVRGPEEEVVGKVRVPVGQGIAGTIASTRQPLILDDVKTMRAVNPFLPLHIRSLMGVPLLVEDRLIGVLHAGTTAPHAFKSQELHLLQLVGERIALAIDGARQFQYAERARREAELQAAERAATIEAMADGVVYFDAQGQLMQMNTAARTMLGHNGEPVFERLPEQERDSRFFVRDEHGQQLGIARWPLSRVLRGEVIGNADAVDLLLRTPAGEDMQVSVTGAPVRDARGNVVGAVCAFRDVTERRRLEHEVIERSGQLSATFEAMVDGVLVYDRQARIVHANAAARRMLAYDRDPRFYTVAVAQRAQIYVLSDKHGEPVAEKDLPARRVLRGELLTGNDQQDYHVRALDGRELLLNLSGAPVLDAKGKIEGAVIVARDVEQQRELERRTKDTLDALLAMARTLISTEEPPATVTEAPPPQSARAIAQRLAELTCGVLGCRRVGILAVESVTQLQRPVAVVGLEPDQEASWWAELEEHPVRYGEGADPDLLAQFTAGKSLVLDMTQPPYNELPNPYGITTSLFAPMRVGHEVIGILSLDYGGEPHPFTPREVSLAEAVAQLGAMAIERDRLQKERTAAEVREQAVREVNQRLDDFVGIAAHDLKSPITSSTLHAQIVARRNARQIERWRATDPDIAKHFVDVQDSLDGIVRDLERLSRLTTRLLDVTRIRTGKLDLYPEPCDLGAIVRQCVEEQWRLEPERTLELSVTSGEELQVLVDPDRIGQVITNFLTNALRYAPDERPITVGVEARDGQARVAVHDEGPGIPQEEQPRIWERFQRLPSKSETPTGATGLGLGLYISREIVEQHGGQIGVASTPQDGTTFWFTVPLLPK